MSLKQVVIFVGGLGTRLGHITKTTPKPLIKIQDKPLIWYTISSLLKSGIDKIIFPLGYKGEMIENYLKKNLNTSSSTIIEIVFKL